jgi:hypothetical protein
MALVSPGVQVSVIDESFYTPAEPGTTPIIFVATAENKTNGAGTGIAPGTLAANAGKVYLLTSQRDLVETFGDPVFKTDANNNPINGGEQNEYGLQAAYSYLGVSNRAFVVRADVDLNSINASATATADNPANGTYWLDTQSTSWGLFSWNSAAISTTGGQTFTNISPIVITDATQTSGSTPYTPKGSVGAVGEYAISAVSNIIRLWYKSGGNSAAGVTSGTWVEVGSEEWKLSWPMVSSTANGTGLAQNQQFEIGLSDSANITVTLTGSDDSLADMVADINTAANPSGIYAVLEAGVVNIYSNGLHDQFTLADGTGTPLQWAGITAGTYMAPDLTIDKHTQVPSFKRTDNTGTVNGRPTGSIWVKTTQPNSGARWRVKAWNSSTEAWDMYDAPLAPDNQTALFDLDAAGGGANLALGSVYVETNLDNIPGYPAADFQIYNRAATGATEVQSAKVEAGDVPAGTYSLFMQETVKGSALLSAQVTVSVTATGAATDADVIANAINAAGFTNVVASVDSGNRVKISHRIGGDIVVVDAGGLLNNIGITTSAPATANYYSEGGNQWRISNWKPLVYTASDDAPTAVAADGALWYSSIIDEVDIMVHNGTTWVGYQDTTAPYYANGTDPAGPIVSASEPTAQSDTSELVTGDIWISTADLENYPRVYVYNAILAAAGSNPWVEVDTTDQTTENGMLFADARYNTSGANSAEAGDITDLLVSNYLDPDAPDPALYPKGMLLWNLRRSGFNVKKFVRNSIDVNGDNARQSDESMSAYYPHRWVTESANEADGSGAFGRKAQRKVVVQALQSMLNSNEDIRDNETRLYNLIATPGYPELIGEMVSLNYDRGLTAFVVGDTPFRLASDATSLNNWSTNVNLAVEDNDNGLVTSDEYLGVYYPSGFTSDNAGNNIIVPASHMVLRTIALNDQVAFPWFAPAGTRRGGVTNATATGFINSEGEFSSIALNEGQRDTLYQNSVNPITFLTGAGITVFGQKTRAANASALDRVNVARLVVYLRSQLNSLAKPYLFEPNDKITRDEIKQQVESLLVELVGLRALFDFLVVCDETNNTPARIDRNELYVDIAIEPVKAVEFIYIPLRLKNTGEIAGL